MPQIKRSQALAEEYLTPQEGKTGYQAVEKALEVRGGPKKAKIGDEEKVFRKYHLTKEKVQAVLAKWHATGAFVSPFSKGVTSDFLMALAALGPNQVWHTGRVAAAMKKLMDVPERMRDGITDWKRYRDREARSGKRKSQTPPKRIETLARNLRKTVGSGSPYPEGRRLEQIGCCVDIFIWDHERLDLHSDPERAAKGEKEVHDVHDVYYRLNTHSTKGSIIRLEDPSEIEKHPVNLKAKGLGPV
jgi:hypothetical protein